MIRGRLNISHPPPAHTLESLELNQEEGGLEQGIALQFYAYLPAQYLQPG